MDMAVLGEILEQTQEKPSFCPLCGQAMWATNWIPRSEGKFVAVATCPEHGDFLRKLRIQAGEEGGGSLQVVQQARCGAETVNASCFLQISGDAVVEMDENGRLFSRTPGTAVVLLGSIATLPATQVPYRMYSAPVTLFCTE